jgi:hypothetical protein
VQTVDWVSNTLNTQYDKKYIVILCFLLVFYIWIIRGYIYISYEGGYTVKSFIVGIFHNHCYSCAFFLILVISCIFVLYFRETCRMFEMIIVFLLFISCYFWLVMLIFVCLLRTYSDILPKEIYTDIEHIILFMGKVLMYHHWVLLFLLILYLIVYGLLNIDFYKAVYEYCVQYTLTSEDFYDDE